MVENDRSVCNTTRMLVVETFEIERGLIVAVAPLSDLPIAQRLCALIAREDGTKVSAVAYKEYLLQRNPKPAENEVFLLHGLKKPDVPIGSEITLEISPNP